MSLRHRHARLLRKPAELNLVPMIDIFTVLVTFLLMTAVFSRITILQLDLPSSDSSAAGAPPVFRLEVIVRHDAIGELLSLEFVNTGRAACRLTLRPNHYSDAPARH